VFVKSGPSRDDKQAGNHVRQKYENTAFRKSRLYGQDSIRTIPDVKAPTPVKMKVTVSLSRAAVAALDRIGAKRVEAGARRRQSKQSALIEEAIHDLRRKEGIR
jgi:hypothetical protein